MKTMKPNLILLLLLSLIFFSCKDSNNEGKVLTSEANSKSPSENKNEVYKIEAKDLLKDFMTWYNYTYYIVRLAQDFIAEDENSNQVEKAIFFQCLTSGDFIAVKAAMKNGVPVYKLFKPEYLEHDIKNTMIQMAQDAITLANMEGKEMPEYHFTDLDGSSYDKNNTKGNVLLIKCWYINCVACVKEFPVLNQLVARYKNRSDIKFISLASDSKKDLISFLQKKPFRYAVVPKMENYMTNKLNVNAYPLHLLINKDGKIVKATNSIEDMMPYFEKAVN